jgi:GntR family transcriptional regulator, transcriptional repressor for pyruvate dehydrogenase complex
VDPVDRLSVTDAIVQRIVDYVRSSHLAPGDRLPGEHELVRILGVSRMSVREALRSLAATGLIEAQPGLGTFVAKPSLLTFLVHGPLPSLLTSLEDVTEFFEARRALEPQILALAAEKATDDEVRTLGELLGLMADTVETGTFDDRPWLDFHGTLFQACHNRLVISMATPITAMMELLFPHTVTARGKEMSEAESQRALEVHRRLFEAVQSRDREMALRAANDHLELAEQELLLVLEENDGNVSALLESPGVQARASM